MTNKKGVKGRCGFFSNTNWECQSINELCRMVWNIKRKLSLKKKIITCLLCFVKLFKSVRLCSEKSCKITSKLSDSLWDIQFHELSMCRGDFAFPFLLSSSAPSFKNLSNSQALQCCSASQLVTHCWAATAQHVPT